jgi:polyketide cyclase/dehydrase/lipid transport protein
MEALSVGQVRAVTSRQVNAPAQAVFDALADYSGVRPRILPAQYSGFEVRSGGVGAGTVAQWRLQATSKRSRNVVATVSSPAPLRLVETDANSSMVVTWSVAAQGDAASQVTVEAVWNGAGGVGGFFERTFAPKGLNRIHDEVLAGLAGAVEPS